MILHFNESKLPPTSLECLYLNTTIANETTLSIGNTTYRYVIVIIYDSEKSFGPKRIQVSGILVKYLPPRNRTITNTGVVASDYLVSYGGKAYKVSLGFIGFLASYNLTVSVSKVNDNIYTIQITTTRLGVGSYVNVTDIILIRDR